MTYPIITLLNETIMLFDNFILFFNIVWYIGLVLIYLKSNLTKFLEWT